MPSRILPERTISIVCARGIELVGNALIGFGLGYAGSQAAGEVDGHDLVQKSRAGVEAKRALPLAGAIAGFLHQFALAGSERILARIEAAGRAAPTDNRGSRSDTGAPAGRAARRRFRRRQGSQPIRNDERRRGGRQSPLGSLTSSEVTLKTLPRKTGLDERSCRRSLRDLWEDLDCARLRIGMFTNI